MVVGEKMTGKNIILITIDSLRADHISCLGYSRLTTPNLDNIANEGILFTQAIATGPETRPSITSILTSTYPLMYGGYSSFFNKRRISLAEILKENGYTTAAFHSNPYLSKFYGYDRGFDIFQDFLKVSPLREEVKKFKEYIKIKYKHLFDFSRRVYGKVYNFIRKLEPIDECANAEAINKEAISWLKNNSSNFFLWLHYMDTHANYAPPKNYKPSYISLKEVRKLNENIHNTKGENNVKKLIDLYDGEIRYVDYNIGLFLNELKKMRISDDTFIIITADHGEEFGEHGGYMHTPKLYDELIRVPLIIIGPELENRIISKQVSLLGLAPTVLDLLNIKKPITFQGDSLLPLMKGMKTEFSDAISEVCVWEKDPFKIDLKKRKTSLRTEQWKYILNEDGSEELYNLQDDPRERKNLVEKEREKVIKFKSKIMKHILTEQEMDEKEKLREKIKMLKKVKKI